MAVSVSHVLESKLQEELWHRFADKASTPDVWHPWSSLAEYEEWKVYLERGVGSFWTAQGERIALLAAYQDGEVKGLLRVLRVPVFPWEIADWGPATHRGEIQDLLYQDDGHEAARELLKAAVRLLQDAGVKKIGASAWRSGQCEVLRQLDFRPFRRSLLLGWRTTHHDQFRPTTGVGLRYIRPGEEALVQEVFSSTWGIRVTVIPRMDIQCPMVAVVEERPVGAALPNKHTSNLDLGVQVVSQYRRKHIGAGLVRECLHYYRRGGFAHMYVVRNLPVRGLTEGDEVALRFYAATGAVPLREYVGFQPP